MSLKSRYIDAKDEIILWRIKRMLKRAKKAEVEMFDKVIKLWQ